MDQDSESRYRVLMAMQIVKQRSSAGKYRSWEDLYHYDCIYKALFTSRMHSSTARFTHCDFSSDLFAFILFLSPFLQLASLPVLQRDFRDMHPGRIEQASQTLLPVSSFTNKREVVVNSAYLVANNKRSLTRIALNPLNIRAQANSDIVARYKLFPLLLCKSIHSYPPIQTQPFTFPPYPYPESQR
ncbi:hypothetical protein EYC84_010902 [Monilinia fructicola]|uniref:Uncharacterized protein n=1 Tax=Monilinia fructicola TaxID=38448 RepID=A0A5M9J6K5_MONFR|nr:hypothetical protein EYC84_010902 [Monilinia fructicola]